MINSYKKLFYHRLVYKRRGWEGYRKHQREDPCLTPDGKPWPRAKPEDMAALREQNKPPAMR
jgi:hypothetical protein